jgi:NAD(P)-dependent dehydrogenase (short-subunit alcohol dehydrogenase family)
MNRLKDQVCLITGASSGIGRAIALMYASEGANVALVARDQAQLVDVAQEIEQGRAGTSLVLAADVADELALRHAVAQIVDRWQRLDVVVANAGINGVWAPIDDLPVHEWRKTLDVNLTGTFITVQAAYPELKRNGGAVIIMSSINGTRVFSNSGATAYACSKAGQVTLTKMLALELAKYRIRVNAICPGAIQTPIFQKTVEIDLEEAREPVEFPEGSIPLTDGRPGSPEQVASVALFLASPESRHVTGTVIFVDGGQSLLQG